MAEFCKQCAADLGMENDFDVAVEDIVQIVLCEGCGPTNVDGHGECIYDCERHHATADKGERGAVTATCCFKAQSRQAATNSADAIHKAGNG